MHDIDFIKGICDGKYLCVFASPEAALGEFRQFLRSVGKSIGLIAIDESHCIVKW